MPELQQNYPLSSAALRLSDAAATSDTGEILQSTYSDSWESRSNTINTKITIDEMDQLAAQLAEDVNDGEDDKRKRNREASQRFRIKAKRKQVALEEKVRTMESLADKLDSRAQELQLENEVLKRTFTLQT